MQQFSRFWARIIYQDKNVVLLVFTIKSKHVHFYWGVVYSLDPLNAYLWGSGPSTPWESTRRPDSTKFPFNPKNAPVRLQFYAQTEPGLRCLIFQMTRLKTSNLRQNHFKIPRSSRKKQQQIKKKKKQKKFFCDFEPNTLGLKSVA